MSMREFALAWLGKRDVYVILADLFASPEWKELEVRCAL